MDALRSLGSKTPPVRCAQFYSRSHDAVIRVYDEAGNVIETHEQAGDFKECEVHFFRRAGRLLVLFLSARAKRQSLQSADRQWID